MTMTKQLKTLTLSLVAAAVFCVPFGSTTTAFGAVTYKYATDVTALNLLPGQLAAVNLYLVETTTDASTSQLVSESGLSSAYVGVAYVTPPGSPLASPSTINSIAANVSLFNDIVPPDAIVAGDHTSAYIREYVDIAQPTGPTGDADPAAAGVRQVFLGTVVVLGGTSGGTTTFRVGDDPVTDDTVTVDGYLTPLDASAAIAPASFTVTIPIPEPTAAAVVTLISCVATARRRRR